VTRLNQPTVYGMLTRHYVVYLLQLVVSAYVLQYINKLTYIFTSVGVVIFVIEKVSFVIFDF